MSARSDDGVIEAVEVLGRTFAVGVQWHPEEDGDVRLFAGLVEAARANRDRVGATQPSHPPTEQSRQDGADPSTPTNPSTRSRHE